MYEGETNRGRGLGRGRAAGSSVESGDEDVGLARLLWAMILAALCAACHIELAPAGLSQASVRMLSNEDKVHIRNILCFLCTLERSS